MNPQLTTGGEDKKRKRKASKKSKKARRDPDLNGKRTSIKSVKKDDFDSDVEVEEGARIVQEDVDGITGLAKLANGEEEWIVEKIMAKREIDGVRHYEVKWYGWSRSCNTWEPMSNLTNCKGLIRHFEWKWREWVRSGGPKKPPIATRAEFGPEEDSDEDDEMAGQRPMAAAAQPSTSSGPQPFTSSAPQPSTSSAPQPSTSSAPQPSTSSAAQASTSAGAESMVFDLSKLKQEIMSDEDDEMAGAAAAQPSTSSATQPSTSSAPQPSTSSAAQASTSTGAESMPFTLSQLKQEIMDDEEEVSEPIDPDEVCVIEFRDDESEPSESEPDEDEIARDKVMWGISYNMLRKQWRKKEKPLLIIASGTVTGKKWLMVRLRVPGEDPRVVREHPSDGVNNDNTVFITEEKFFEKFPKMLLKYYEKNTVITQNAKTEEEIMKEAARSLFYYNMQKAKVVLNYERVRNDFMPPDQRLSAEELKAYNREKPTQYQPEDEESSEEEEEDRTLANDQYGLPFYFDDNDIWEDWEDAQYDSDVSWEESPVVKPKKPIRGQVSR